MSMNLKPAAWAIGVAKQAIMRAAKASGRIVLDKEPIARYLV